MKSKSKEVGGNKKIDMLRSTGKQSRESSRKKKKKKKKKKRRPWRKGIAQKGFKPGVKE